VVTGFAGERVRASISRFLTDKLHLKVNEAKSAVARPEERKFLGFSIANDGSDALRRKLSTSSKTESGKSHAGREGSVCSR
jgi:hypothetical protein